MFKDRLSITKVFLLPQAPIWLHTTPVTDLVTISIFDDVLIMELLAFVVIFLNMAFEYYLS